MLRLKGSPCSWIKISNLDPLIDRRLSEPGVSRILTACKCCRVQQIDTQRTDNRPWFCPTKSSKQRMHSAPPPRKIQSTPCLSVRIFRRVTRRNRQSFLILTLYYWIRKERTGDVWFWWKHQIELANRSMSIVIVNFSTMLLLTDPHPEPHSLCAKVGQRKIPLGSPVRFVLQVKQNRRGKCTTPRHLDTTCSLVYTMSCLARYTREYTCTSYDYCGMCFHLYPSLVQRTGGTINY
jgi:hypothetical protein